MRILINKNPKTLKSNQVSCLNPGKYKNKKRKELFTLQVLMNKYSVNPY